MTKLILITGPSGAGKTTVCRELLKTLAGEWAYINQDEVRQYVKCGYVSADEERNKWTEAVQRQWDVSIPICAEIVKNYIKIGIGCIVDFFVYPNELEIWNDKLKGVSFELIILMPDISVLQHRNANRSVRSKLSSEKINENYKLYSNSSFINGKVVDNSNLSANKTVDVIKKLANII